MANPGDAASKLLLGTGIGLLLIAGFGLIEQRMSVDELSLGWLFVLLGLIFLGLGKTLDSNSGPLSQAFPDETAEQLAVRVRNDINTSIKDASVGSAWAELEANVLEQELSQEE
ncbi:MAG TPA: hypothetical protein HA356_00870 [Candidatus Poseidoniaceae archaeon]|nr:MAG TPA: hypothetical protein D7H95_00880 [Candidatus Poseidoniales archaeon]HII10608.1 hypothetical protein [Candidatus Poseidoniaceae archaeon]|tara:strand:+ start:264 stop:605 length:342 start_codon:yes stop_codon:yes gene_type:complete